MTRTAGGLVTVALYLVLSAGCATSEKKLVLVNPPITPVPVVVSIPVVAPIPQTPPPQRLTADVVFFNDIREIDLDGDHEKEIIAIYITDTYSRGIKVIKINKQTQKAEVVYKRSFSIPPATRFALVNGSPSIIYDDVDPETGRQGQEAYCWNGKAFVPSGKKK